MTSSPSGQATTPSANPPFPIQNPPAATGGFLFSRRLQIPDRTGYWTVAGPRCIGAVGEGRLWRARIHRYPRGLLVRLYSCPVAALHRLHVGDCVRPEVNYILRVG